MKPTNIHIILFVGTLLFSIPCAGQGDADAQLFRDSLHRHIPGEMSTRHSCQFVYEPSSSIVVPNLGANQSELNGLDDFIREALGNANRSIKKIRLTGYSSIEGAYHTNAQLAQDRVKGFYQYLRDTYPELYRYPHDFAWIAEDWKGLSQMVGQSALNEREEILEIIRKVPGFDEREQLLVYLNGGRAYGYMEREMFPRLRRVEMEIYSVESYDAGNEALQAITQPTHHSELNTQDSIDEWLGLEKRKRNKKATGSDKPTGSFNEPTTSPYGYSSFQKEESLAAQPTQKQRSTQPMPPLQGGGAQRAEGVDAKFALKTNLLLWAGVQADFKYTAPVANIAVEYYITKNWSIEAGAMYSYRNYNNNREFQGISGYRIEPRYSLNVFGSKCGAYLGLYGRMGDYDRRSVDKGQLTVDSYHADKVNRAQSTTAQPTVNYQLSTVNYTGDYWDAGLSAGITINLVAGLGVEIGARAGYVNTKSIRYNHEDGYNWYESEKKYSKIRITDLNMSLVYRFR